MKAMDKKPPMYAMLPFISVQASRMLDKYQSAKLECHLKCCKLLKDEMVEYHNLSVDERTNDRKLDFIRSEISIWSCIYRALGKGGDLYVREETKDGSENVNKPAGTLRSPNYSSTTPFTILKELIGENDIDDDQTALTMGKGKYSGSKEYTKIISSDHEDDMFYDEEMLVVYYVSNLIFDHKYMDAARTISEYMEKPSLSSLCLANLLKFYGALYMMSDGSENMEIALDYFKTSIFHSEVIGSDLGEGICYLGVAKICHDYLTILAAKSQVDEEDFKTDVVRLATRAQAFLENNEDNSRIANECENIIRSLEDDSDISDSGEPTEIKNYNAIFDGAKDIFFEVLITQ